MTSHFTRGNPLAITNLLSTANPTQNRVTVVCDQDNQQPSLFTQAIHQIGSQSVKLSYLIADESANAENITCMLEEVVRETGHWGIFNLTCELESNSPFFEAFRRADFKVWAKEHFWQFPTTQDKPVESYFKWRIWNSEDIRAMQLLYQTLVPSLFHSVEPLSRKTMLGMILFSPNGDLLAYADLVYGRRGIWVLPIVQPQAANEPALLTSLIDALPSKRGRPVTICVRSYQPWLEDTLMRMEAECSPEYILMVKYLALRQKVQNVHRLNPLENGQTDTGIPVAHFEQKDKLFERK